jgi:CubicO group peptidase (beta-lactamase class C family)
MKPWKKVALLAAGVLLAVLAATTAYLASKTLPIGTGYVAKYLCSSTFVSVRDPGTVFEEDVKPVNPIAKLVTYEIDHTNRLVTADAFGLFPLTAVYNDGCGCTLVIGTTIDDVRNLQLAGADFAQNRPRQNETKRWPHGSKGPADPVAMGLDKDKLDRALDLAFREVEPGAPRKSRAVVVVYDGRLVAERYAPGFHKDMALLGWSMSKSVTNTLVGLLVREGRLDIHAPAPVAEWSLPGDPRRQITLDQLLRMSSGLAFEEVYAPLTDATDMLYGSYNFAAFAAAKGMESEPDGSWYYSSGTANIIARIVRQTIEKDEPAYYRYLYRRLFDRIGMHSAVMEMDASGTFVGSSYALATPRDWARFGLLYLNDGVWQGERLLPQGWVAYSTTPTPKAPMGEYGALFWLNAGEAGNSENRKWPSAPTDAYAAQGFQEQKVIIIPSKKLVLVRFGATSNRAAWDTNDFINNILAALPTSQ